MTKNEPLVSVGLPTYNRVAMCKRAIESVLAQEYSRLELIISDNASTDGTEEMCLELARRDQRIRYIRQETNQGATPNFVAVMEAATGKYFMWLGDDDWIENTFVSHCVSHLEDDASFSIITGKTIFHAADGVSKSEGEIINYVHSSPRQRVISYYETVGKNESFYGVMRREYVKQIRSTLKNVVGNDWHICAALIFLGKAKTIESTAIHRSEGGASTSAENVAISLAVHAFQAKNFILSISWFAFHDILIGSRVYKSLPFISRSLLAVHAFRAVKRRQPSQLLIKIRSTLSKEFLREYFLPKIVRVLQIMVPHSSYAKIRDWYRRTKETR